MSRILKFEVSIVFSEEISNEYSIYNIAENIARAIKNEANGEGIAPKDGEVFTQFVEVKHEKLKNVSLKIY